MTSPTAASAATSLDSTSAAPVVTADQLRRHWQAHRRLSRRMIEAFPEDALFNFSLGGMRPYAELAVEMLAMAGPVVRGVASGNWGTYTKPDMPATRAELLRLWDTATAEIDQTWATLSPDRFQVVDSAFGQWEGPGYQTIWYALDNEIHHRGQGYVYLRALGIEPPAFWERG
jgi:uncharacterized damage-inducible protein DinB